MKPRALGKNQKRNADYTEYGVNISIDSKYHSEKQC